MTEAMERAATARKADVLRRGDRPRERRAMDSPGGAWASRAVTRHPVEVRAASGDSGTGLDFTGYASVTERSYDMFDFFGPYEEVVSGGAFTDTLNLADLDVPLVLGHDPMRRIARTTNGSLLLAEDETGLRTDAPNLDENDADVAYIVPKLRSGLIDEMSFRFTITSGTWSPDYTEFRINAADIQRGDVSIVGYGASPHTSAEMRGLVSKIQHALVLKDDERDLLARALVQDLPAKAAEVVTSVVTLRASDDLAGVTAEDVVALFRNVRRELRIRGITPPMSFSELLSA